MVSFDHHVDLWVLKNKDIKSKALFGYACKYKNDFYIYYYITSFYSKNHQEVNSVGFSMKIDLKNTELIDQKTNNILKKTSQKVDALSLLFDESWCDEVLEVHVVPYFVVDGQTISEGDWLK